MCKTNLNYGPRIFLAVLANHGNFSNKSVSASSIENETKKHKVSATYSTMFVINNTEVILIKNIFIIFTVITMVMLVLHVFGTSDLKMLLLHTT